MLVYSGIGIAFDQVNNRYFINYIIFYLIFMITIILIFKLNHVSPTKKNTSILDISIDRFNWVYFFLSALFIMTFFIYLIFPEVRVSNLWNPPPPSLIGIFDKREMLYSNNILYVSNLLNLLLKPFFFLYLYKLKKYKKNFKIIIWIFLWVYLDYLSIGYIARNQMVVYFIFFFFLFTLDIDKGVQLKKKYLSMIMAVGIMSIPFLISYESVRLGKGFYDISFSESIPLLLEKESYYPIYFNFIEQITTIIKPLDYILWLICLPIPSLIMPNKFTLEINKSFTYFLNGTTTADSNFTISLPSVLGEAMLVFDSYFYWIHAIILGILIGYTCILTEKYKPLIILNLYFAVQVVTIGRGGSQGYIGEVINSSIILVFWILFLKMINLLYAFKQQEIKD
jgi:hypothetical protein